MRGITRLTREYPNYNGIPVDPKELSLPKSMLDLSRAESINNHHWNFRARKFGATLISQTFRDLDVFQTVLPKDTHAILHDRYDEPHTMPDQTAMIEIIDEQRAANGLLRYGSANHPHYRGIDDTLWNELMREYNMVA